MPPPGWGDGGEGGAGTGAAGTGAGYGGGAHGDGDTSSHMQTASASAGVASSNHAQAPWHVGRDPQAEAAAEQAGLAQAYAVGTAWDLIGMGPVGAAGDAEAAPAEASPAEASPAEATGAADGVVLPEVHVEDSEDWWKELHRLNIEKDWWKEVSMHMQGGICRCPMRVSNLRDSLM